MAGEAVLDASAIIALLRNEPGAAFVRNRLLGAAACAVNVAEVGDSLVRQGVSLEIVRQAVEQLSLTVVPLNVAVAWSAADLLPATRSVGLSLGDRCCLALAKDMNRPALTSDKAWTRIADQIGVTVELIR